MTSVKRKLSVVACMLVVIAMALETRAEARDPLRLTAFEAFDLDGIPVGSDELPLTSRWLLIYVRPNCLPCEFVLNILKKDQPPALRKKIIVVVGTVEGVKDAIAQSLDLAHAPWDTNVLQNIRAELRVRGAPVVLGVRQNTIEWSMNGILTDSSSLKSIFKTWLEEWSPSPNDRSR